MEKRKLSAIPREEATADMLEIAGRLGSMNHIVTASLIEEETILCLCFYDIEKLTRGIIQADFRTFLSKEDYITQDLRKDKVKWLTASFVSMEQQRTIDLVKYTWDEKYKKLETNALVFIRSNEEQQIILDFFKEFERQKSSSWRTFPEPWERVRVFQQSVMDSRLDEKHKKVTDKIDKIMEPINEPPKSFYDWIWETGMSFSRYLIYKEVAKGKAECECTYCKSTATIDRGTIRLRNNERGKCPFCGSKVTFKARGKMASTTRDERYFIYVDPTDDGFVLRYFWAKQTLSNDSALQVGINKNRIEQRITEDYRVFYSFSEDKKIRTDNYSWAVYKGRGNIRWCPVEADIYKKSILYPENLPQAWSHTPMKYSALEVLSENMPTVPVEYEIGIRRYLEFPKLEWLCKMGLNQLAKSVIEKTPFYGLVGKINYKGKTIYEILGLTKINIKILQAIDGNGDHLRLLQVAQAIGFQFKPMQLQEYYEVFECNTDLLKQANRKVSLHKLVKYLAKESENYPLGARGGCGLSYHYRYKERTDPRIERKQNIARDWLEYLNWCKALKYDLDNMFIYMPKNFKKVHDRTAKEYQALQDRKAAAEKKRQETLVERRSQEVKMQMEDIFKKNEDTGAFSIKGNGLVLLIPANAEEIKTEGHALHHCVGGYVKRVAEGKTNIFFIRKATEPKKPYFTLEFNNNRIIQCRGVNNCGMPVAVESFVKTFEKKMQEAARKENVRKIG